MNNSQEQRSCDSIIVFVRHMIYISHKQNDKIANSLSGALYSGTFDGVSNKTYAKITFCAYSEVPLWHVQYNITLHTPLQEWR